MRSRRGFTLLEILIVVAILAMIAAIAMNNYFNAMHRARQKRTMADIRGIALAWEARAVDTKQYNASGLGFTLPATVITAADAIALLTPTYIRNMPVYDAWGNPLEFRLDEPIGGAVPAATYALRSPGRDGKYQATYVEGPTTDFDCDIVYSGGTFIVWPEGTQQK